MQRSFGKVLVNDDTVLFAAAVAYQGHYIAVLDPLKKGHMRHREPSTQINFHTHRY